MIITSSIIRPCGRSAGSGGFGRNWEYHLWGLSPAGYHIVNALVHAGGVILLWRILVRLEIPGAWLAAAFFAIHPVQVESVAWVTERKNVLSGLFYFLSALLYLRWLSVADVEGSSNKDRQRNILYAFSLGAFVLALLSKTVACTLPVALLIIQWWKNQGRLRLKDFARLGPFFILGGALAMVTAWMERHHVGAGNQGGGEVWTLSFADRILIAGRALWFYVYKLLWPAKLTFIYPKWQITTGVIGQWIFPAAVGIVVLLLWVARRRIGRGPLVAVLFFVVTLAPALGFVDVFPFRYSYVADHFQYMACAGLLVLAAVGLRQLPRPALAVLLVFLALLTWRQTAIYRNLESLWRDTLSKNPGSWMAHSNLAMTLLSDGRTEESLKHLEAAESLKPDSFEIESTLGWIYLESGRLDDAFPRLRKAAATGAIDPMVHFNLATVYYRKGELFDATDELKRALAFDPRYVPALNELGAILLAQGRTPEALSHLEKAVAEDPEFLSARFNLANTLLQAGRRTEAIEQLNQALSKHPESAEAQKNLAWVLATSPDDAVRDGRRAVELAENARRQTNGRDPIVLITLAAAYAETGRFPDAIRTAEEARQLAEAAGNNPLAEGIRGYITLYQYSQPFRDTR
jgi:tetratricopeptide (TPR) repeat protein